MSTPTSQSGEVQPRPERWGLALSGGGFRASFFHVGVLRRLAELGMLGRLNVISTVSGGSIVGALYLMRLKQAIEKRPDGALDMDDYLALTEDVERDLATAVSYNLRTRLLALPSRNLAILCTRFPLGRRMAELYDQQLYRLVTGETGLGLKDLRVKLTASRSSSPNIETYNAAAPTTRIPKLVLNATSLNSGKPFRFTAAEIGDPVLGLLRFDEAHLVVGYKRALARRPVTGKPDPAEIVRALALVDAGAAVDRTETGFRPEAPERQTPHRSCHVAWWLAAEALPAPDAQAFAAIDAGWPVAAALGLGTPAAEAVARVLLTAPLGLLRKAKLAAWFYREGALRGQARQSQAANAQRLREALRELGLPASREPDQPDPPHDDDSLDPPLVMAIDTHADAVADFVLDLYYFRSAKAFSEDAAATMAELRVVDAVAASANFPPVFPPFVVQHLYDAHAVESLGLTDGGVYDNQGTVALIEEECTHVIVSDAGGALEPGASPPGRLTMMGRFVSILMGNIREAQIADLRQRRAANQIARECPLPAQPDGANNGLVEALHRLRTRTQLEGLAFFHIAAKPEDANHEHTVTAPLPPHPQARAVALLRTDLDIFAPEEIDALVYQGYQLCDRYVRGYLPAETGDAIAAMAPTSPAPDPEREARILRAGASRVGRAFLVETRSTQIAVLVLLAAAALAALVLSRATLASAGNVLGELAGLPARGSGIPVIAGLVRGCVRFWSWLRDTELTALAIVGALALGFARVSHWWLVPSVRRISGIRRMVRFLRLRSHAFLELGVLLLLGFVELRLQLLDRLWDLVARHQTVVGFVLAGGAVLGVLFSTRSTRRVVLRQLTWLLAGAPLLLALALSVYAWTSYALVSPVARRTRHRPVRTRRVTRSDQDQPDEKAA